MAFTPPTTRRALLRTASVAAAAFSMGLLAPAAALADPPPNCTAADLASTASDVAASTSAYLFSHPDVNDFYTGLHNLPADEVSDAVSTYFAGNPQAHDDLLAIRQPMADFRSRCGLAPRDQPLLGE